MEHEVPGGVEQGSLPQYLLGCIFKALFMNESTLILRYKQKLFMAGTFVLILWCVCHHIYSKHCADWFSWCLKALFVARL